MTYHFSKNYTISTAIFKALPYIYRFDARNEVDELPSYHDPHNIKKPFKPHYDKHILPQIKRYEAKRRAAIIEASARLHRDMKWAPLLILIIIGFFLLSIELGIGITILIIFAFMFDASGPISHYQTSVKRIIFPSIFSFFGKEFSYNPKAPFSVRRFENMGIIPYFEDEHTEDYIKGRYKDVGIQILEAKLTKESGSGKNQSTTTVFKGLMILLDLDKRFYSKTIVKRDAGKLFNALRGAFSDLKKVNLVDHKFEDEFEVYSSDQMEARYILDPLFMENLLKLDKLFDNAKLQCSFLDNQMLLMLRSKKNYFEVSSIEKPATFEGDIHTILKQMKYLFQIIDILKIKPQWHKKKNSEAEDGIQNR